MYSACAPNADCRGLGHDAGGMGKSDGDPDGIARPLRGYLQRVPWASTPTAQVVCHMVDAAEGKDLWFDPRVILPTSRPSVARRDFIRSWPANSSST